MRPFYSLIICLFLSLSVYSQSKYTVHFAWGAENFPDNYASISQNHQVFDNELAEGMYQRYIQFQQVLGSTERAALEAQGVQLLGYVTYATYLVGLPQWYDLKRLEPFAPRSIMRILPEWKMAISLKEQPYGKWAVHGNQIDVIVELAPYISIESGAALLQQQGITILEKGNLNGYLQVRLPNSQLLGLAGQAMIRSLELAPPPGEAEDKGGRSLHRSNIVDSEYSLGDHYDGTGIKVLVRDDGLVGPHIDFKNRLDNRALENSAVNHADWVSGSLTGAGNLNPDTKGMASGADLFVSDYRASFMDGQLSELLGEGVQITNTSYSDGCNTGYTQFAQNVDWQIYQNPELIHVFSSGNRGDNNCGYGAGNLWGNITGGHKMSKNSISVGNLEANAVLTTSSSRGPTTDGRLKPEICAHGTDVTMTQPGNTYSVATGTSFSAPAVAGCMAQLAHAYKSLNNGTAPEFGLIKAVVMNTANDLGNEGPDFKTGFGHINTWRALNTLKQIQWLSGSVAQGATQTHTIQVPDNTRQLKVMIYWVDRPGDSDAEKALVNDLDIRATDAASINHFPWKLDPTPNAAILDAPAGRGRDSLNNMEQIMVDLPLQGAMNITVSGFEVPFGPQQYYLVWEFVTSEITLTYPAGGEGFVPGEKERIHWDAVGTNSNFVLGYSVDNGINWTTITTVSGEKRMYDWTVPTNISGQVYLRVSRDNNSSTSAAPLSIIYVPESLKVLKVCPDSMIISWSPISDTLSYDVYLLGEKYMEIQTTVDTNQAVLYIQDAGEEQWVSARVHWPAGNGGRRANALRWPGELKACPQQIDGAIRQMASPVEPTLISCGPASRPVTIKIRNEGLGLLSGAMAHYQMDNQTVVSEAVPDINPGDSLLFTFTTLATFTSNGLVTIKTWLDAPGEQTPFNNDAERTYEVLVDGSDEDSFVDFEAASTLPNGWLIQNPDNNITWQLLQATTLIGSNGAATRALFLDIYNYPSLGQEDYIYITPLNLTSLNEPTLVFDVAYANYLNAPGNDRLKIEVFPDCQLSSAPVVIWEKQSNELQTADATNDVFVPASPEDWRQEIVDLQQFSGQPILVRFTSVNEYGNNMYIDNIRFVNQSAVLPEATFVSTLDSVCRLDTVKYLATTSPDPSLTINWAFGLQAQPAAATGFGPHNVRYLTAGTKTVRMIATNVFGADTTFLSMKVINFPTSNFSFVSNTLTVDFTNLSTNATNYFWTFGDGATSIEKDPIHTYANPGVYPVKLIAENECRTVEKILNVSATVGTQDLESLGIQVLVIPNPTQDDFKVQVQSNRINGPASLSFMDAQGKQIKSLEVTLQEGILQHDFVGLNLAKGVYTLQLQSSQGTGHYRVVIQ
jgi:PKD repeat protein